MIVSFNPSIFETDDEHILEELSHIFEILITDRHLFDIESIYPIIYDETGYIFNENNFSTNFLSPYKKTKVQEYFEYILQKNTHLTNLHKRYLTKITIGLNEDEINPKLARRILNQQSIIIVENGTNDWKFIRGIAKKYRNHPTRKDIYSKIHTAVDSLWIRAEHAAGKGQIIPRFNDLSSNDYGDISKYKLMTIFDSDRDNSTYLQIDQKRLIEYLKAEAIHNIEEAVYEDGDLIVWHMFYKRELENYVPLDVILSDFSLTHPQEFHLRSLNPNQLDFFHYVRYLGATVDVKRDFPEAFLRGWDRNLLESRCQHHEVDIPLPSGASDQVSEIEQILLKIAKII